MQASDIPPAGLGLQCKIQAMAAVGEGSKCSRTGRGHSPILCSDLKRGKGFPYSIPSVGPVADPGVQAVSPQVTVKSSTRR